VRSTRRGREFAPPGACDTSPGRSPGLRSETPTGSRFAGELATNVWPELYDNLVTIVAENIDLQPDDASRAYWEAVYDPLTQ
jgi:hypothetical protein